MKHHPNAHAHTPPEVSKLPGLSLDEARLRPHLRTVQASIFIREYDRATTEGTDVSAPRSVVPSPGELRGIPVIGHGGAIPGTNPAKQADRLTA